MAQNKAPSQRPQYVVNIASRLDVERWSPGWIADIGRDAEAHLKVNSERLGAAYLRHAIRFATLTAHAVAQGDAEAAAALAAGALQAAWQAEMVEAYPVIGPKVHTGEKFIDGRKPGTVGAVRKFVRRYMAKHPDARAATVWAALAAKPPRGVEVYEAAGNMKAYIRTPGQSDTGYARFANIVSEERPK